MIGESSTSEPLILSNMGKNLAAFHATGLGLRDIRQTQIR